MFANRSVRGVILLSIFQQTQELPSLRSLEHLERVTEGQIGSGCDLGMNPNCSRTASDNEL
jgi:hypothetical protein